MNISNYAINMNSGQSSNWCFTLNNYCDDDEAKLQQLVEDNHAVYLVYGREVGESGTPHLQGFVSFRKRIRFNQAQRLVGFSGAHLERARLPQQAAEYCKKDGNFVELGELRIPGKRDELEEFKKAAKEGGLSVKDARERFSNVYARYKHFVVEYIADCEQPPLVVGHELRAWQQSLYLRLILPPDSRTIVFVVDQRGNNGKTWFAHYFSQLHDNSQVIIPGKKADMAYLLDTSCTTFFFDAPRSKQGEFIQYDFLEEIKNGYVFSPKYESRLKRLKPCHVVVLTNEHPDMTKLSEDRYDIINI